VRVDFGHRCKTQGFVHASLTAGGDCKTPPALSRGDEMHLAVGDAPFVSTCTLLVESQFAITRSAGGFVADYFVASPIRSFLRRQWQRCFSPAPPQRPSLTRSAVRRKMLGVKTLNLPPRSWSKGREAQGF